MHDAYHGVPRAGSEAEPQPGTEAALLAGEEKYRTLFENMAEEVHLWRLVRDDAGEILTWRLVDANPPTLKTWGRSSVDEIRGKTTDEIFGEGATEHYLPVVRKIFSEGGPHSYEDYFPHLDKHFRFTSVPIGDYFITTGADITEVKKANEALRQNEGRLRAMFEGHGAAMLLIEPDSGQILDANAAAERFYGYSREQLRAMRIQEINQRAPEQVAEERRRAADSAKNMFIFPHRLASGEIRHVEVYSSSVVIQGRPTLFSIIHDATARLRAEEALRETEARFAVAQENARFGIWEKDFETGAMTWDPIARELYGIPAGVPLTEEIRRDRVHPEDREEVEATVTDAVMTRTGLSGEHRVVLPGGEVRWLSVLGKANYDPATGAPRSVTGVLFDVTDRKRAEEELRQSREDLDRAQAVGQIGWWRLNTREDVLTWSDENYRIFGVPEGTPLTYESFLACIHPDDREYVDARWQAGVRGEPYDIEHRLLVEGQVRWVREKAFLEHDAAGALLGGFGIAQDITDLKLAEQALRENEAERAALDERARLARDLHDSVTQALFAATLKAESLTLAGDSLSEATSQAVEELRRLNRGALGQMRTLLLELRGEPLEHVPIAQLLRNLVEAAEGRARVDVRLTVRGDEQSIPELHVPIYRITQEALTNVTRHARASRAWVDLEIDAATVRLIVGDDGRGFEPFEADPSHMGLRSMRERAEEAGGRLDIASDPGAGTVITVDWRRQ